MIPLCSDVAVGKSGELEPGVRCTNSPLWRCHRVLFHQSVRKYELQYLRGLFVFLLKCHRSFSSLAAFRTREMTDLEGGFIAGRFFMSARAF